MPSGTAKKSLGKRMKEYIHRANTIRPFMEQEQAQQQQQQQQQQQAHVVDLSGSTDDAVQEGDDDGDGSEDALDLIDAMDDAPRVSRVSPAPRAVSPAAAGVPTPQATPPPPPAAAAPPVPVDRMWEGLMMEIVRCGELAIANSWVTREQCRRREPTVPLTSLALFEVVVRSVSALGLVWTADGGLEVKDVQVPVELKKLFGQLCGCKDEFLQLNCDKVEVGILRQALVGTPLNLFGLSMRRTDELRRVMNKIGGVVQTLCGMSDYEAGMERAMTKLGLEDGFDAAKLVDTDLCDNDVDEDEDKCDEVSDGEDEPGAPSFDGELTPAGPTPLSPPGVTPGAPGADVVVDMNLDAAVDVSPPLSSASEDEDEHESFVIVDGAQVSSAQVTAWTTLSDDEDEDVVAADVGDGESVLDGSFTTPPVRMLPALSRPIESQDLSKLIESRVDELETARQDCTQLVSDSQQLLEARRLLAEEPRTESVSKSVAVEKRVSAAVENLTACDESLKEARESGDNVPLASDHPAIVARNDARFALLSELEEYERANNDAGARMKQWADEVRASLLPVPAADQVSDGDDGELVPPTEKELDAARQLMQAQHRALENVQQQLQDAGRKFIRALAKQRSVFADCQRALGSVEELSNRVRAERRSVGTRVSALMSAFEEDENASTKHAEFCALLDENRETHEQLLELRSLEAEYAAKGRELRRCRKHIRRRLEDIEDDLSEGTLLEDEAKLERAKVQEKEAEAAELAAEYERIGARIRDIKDTGRFAEAEAILDGTSARSDTVLLKQMLRSTGLLVEQRFLGDFVAVDHDGAEQWPLIHVVQNAGEREHKLLRRLPDSDVRQIRNETWHVGSVEHPHVLPVEAVFFDDPHAYIQHPWVDGMPMAQWIAAKRGTVGDMETFALTVLQSPLRQLLTAVEHIHSKGVVHGGLCPGAVWMTADDEAHLCGFGLSTKCQFSGSPSQQQLPAEVARYAAPEVQAGQRPSPASDMFAFGKMLCEALLGGDDVREFELDDLHGLVVRMLDDDPSARPSASELLESEFFSRAAVSREADSRHRMPFVVKETFLQTKAQDLRQASSVARVVHTDDVLAEFAALLNGGTSLLGEVMARQGDTMFSMAELLPRVWDEARDETSKTGTPMLDFAGDGGQLLPHPHFHDHKRLEALGGLLLKSLVDGVPVAAPFAPTLFKFLLDLPVHVDDLAAFSREEYESLMAAKPDDGVAFVPTATKPLRDGGAVHAPAKREESARLFLTSANSSQWTRHYVEWFLVGQRKSQLESMKRGFLRAGGEQLAEPLSHFDADELAIALCAKQALDCRAAAKSLHFGWSDGVVRAVVRALQRMGAEKRRRLVLRATGSPVVPAGGLKGAAAIAVRKGAVAEVKRARRLVVVPDTEDVEEMVAALGRVIE